MVAGEVITKYYPEWGNVISIQGSIKKLNDQLALYLEGKIASAEIDKSFTALFGSINTDLTQTDVPGLLVNYNTALTNWNTLKSCAGARVKNLKDGTCINPTEITKELGTLECKMIKFDEWLANKPPYQTDGHYSTVFLICKMLGISNAKDIATWTEYPDNIVTEKRIQLRTTWGTPEFQTRVHALTSGFHSIEEYITLVAILNCEETDMQTLGELIHRYGDTYAHTRIEDRKKPIELRRLYGELFDLGFITLPITREHAHPDGSEPDLIKNDYKMYLRYVTNLSEILAVKYKKKESDLNIQLFEKMAKYANNNGVSLIGIINYEIAKFENKKTFTLPFPIIGLAKPGDMIGHTLVSMGLIIGEWKNYEIWVENTKR